MQLVASAPVCASLSPTMQLMIRSGLSNAGMRQQVPQVFTFVDRSRYFRGNVAGDPMGPGKLSKQSSNPPRLRSIAG